LVTVVLIGLGAATPARAGGGAGSLCIEDTQVDPGLGAALERLITVAVAVREPGQCTTGEGALVGRFSGRSPVMFTLQTESGEALSRAVPWLKRPDAALVRLRSQGRLSAFAVLVEGLLAERRTAAGSEDAPAG